VKLSQIIKEANNLSDEQEAPEIVTSFINDAIAQINVHCDANFPFLDLTTDSEPAFPETWQRVLLIPFAVGRIKQKDSSQFEFTQAYSEFFSNLDNFKMKYIIPDAYKDTSSASNGSYESDIYTTPPTPWGGSW
jgi:hypothetical protein